MKQTPRPYRLRAKAENRVIIMVFKGSSEFRDWLARFSKQEGMSATTLVEEGLVRCAIARKFCKPPRRRLKNRRAN